MPKTKDRLKEYWDSLVLKNIPPHAKFEKALDEIKEHFSFIKWMWKRLLIPLIVFYAILGIVLHKNILGSLFVSLLVFIYSNLLPDADILVKKAEEGSGRRESLWYELSFLLFFAPVVLYYVLNGRANPLYSKTSRPFHNLGSALAWGLFLFFIASLFWPDDLLHRAMLPIFGMAGYVFHLTVDKIINIWKIRFWA